MCDILITCWDLVSDDFRGLKWSFGLYDPNSIRDTMDVGINCDIIGSIQDMKDNFGSLFSDAKKFGET